MSSNDINDILAAGQPEGFYEGTTDPAPELKITTDSKGGEFSGLVAENPLAPSEFESAFAKVYKLAGLDPKDYRIIEDTVTLSIWQQSARSKNGHRDLITLYSYKAKFQRISQTDRETEELLDRLSKSAMAVRKLPRRTPGAGLGAPCSYTLLPSDWQIGKGEIREKDLHLGKTGVEQTVARVHRAIEKTEARIKHLRAAGRNIESISIGFMGDPTENVADSYLNQPYTVELNLKDQIYVSLDLMTLMCERLLPLSDAPADVFAVLCNHGQLSRKGTKTNISDDADNVQNLLMQLLQDRIIGPAFPDTRWHLPGSEMITTLAIAGVPVAAAHGHKIPSGINGEHKWLSSQTANLAEKRSHRPRLWLTAHRHSLDVKDYGPFHRIQAATADGGSKHFEDGSGVYSTPGTAVALIGNHDDRGFSDVELL